MPAAFALICALAFRHYDLVYRLRHRGVTPPRWVDLAGLGWDGRLAARVPAAASPALLPRRRSSSSPRVLGASSSRESVAGWTGTVRTQQTAVYEEEEDEGQ